MHICQRIMYWSQINESHSVCCQVFSCLLCIVFFFLLACQKVRHVPLIWKIDSRKAVLYPQELNDIILSLPCEKSRVFCIIHTLLTHFGRGFGQDSSRRRNSRIFFSSRETLTCVSPSRFAVSACERSR